MGQEPGTHLEVAEAESGKGCGGGLLSARAQCCPRSPADKQSPTANYSPRGGNPTPLFLNNRLWGGGSGSGEEGAE